MSLRRCLFLLLIQVGHAAVPAPATGDAGDAGWAALPAGFAPWPGRIRLSTSRGPLDLGADKEPSWSADGMHEVQVDRTRLRFTRGEGRGTITVLVGAGSDEVDAEADVSLRELAGAVPARLSPRGSRDVVFLGMDGGGLDAARGLYDPVTDRGLDLGLVDEELSIRFDRSGPVARLHIGGRLPRGRDAVLLSWVEKNRVLGLAPDRPSGPRGRPPAGWSLPGGATLAARAEEIVRKALLLPGASLEIGDGWQGKARRTFAAPSRNWLEALEGGTGDAAAGVNVPAGRLRALGFRPVLWIVPHGQGERRVFEKSPRAFVRDEDGSAVPSRFLGAYVVDGTSPEGKEYVKDLFARLRSSGCRAFRLAGLGEALEFYEREQAKLAAPGPPLDVLRATIRAARAGVGEDAALFGDVDTPPGLAGELDAARPVVSTGEALEPLGLDALAAARGYRFHASAWWTECLPVERWEAEGSAAAASSRIAFAALTGRGLVVNASESLPGWSREPLLRAWPPLPVRPLDLFPLDAPPRVWDLKVGGDGAGSDIAGVFNWSAVRSTAVDLSPRDLGIARGNSTDRILFFDLSTESFAGVTASPLDLFLLPGHSRLLALGRDLRQPQVIAASVHALGGAGLFEGVTWSDERLELTGRLAVPPTGAGRGPMRLHVAAGGPYRALRAEACGMEAKVEDRGGHVTVSLPEPADDKVPFGITFERAAEPARLAGSGCPEGLEVTFAAEERKPLISWRGVTGGLEGWRSIDGFAVIRDGKEVGQTRGTTFLDRGASLGATHRYSVRARPAPGPGKADSQSPGLESPGLDFAVPPAADAFLDGWCAASHAGSRPPALRRSAVGGPISMGGRRFERGIGVQAPSRIEYLIDGAFEAFEAVPGVDDAARFGGSVVFAVQVDGAERFRSRVVRGGPEEPAPLRVSLAGGRVLTLIVEDAGDGTEGDFADWGAARVLVAPGR